MLSVIVFDAVASSAALLIGFDYGYAVIGSCVLYVAFGFLASRARTVGFATVVGVLIGLTDATLGWAVSWAIGPGRLEAGMLTPWTWVNAASLVVALAAICALLGAVIARYTQVGRRSEH